jgi:hypothetical protein
LHTPFEQVSSGEHAVPAAHTVHPLAPVTQICVDRADPTTQRVANFVHAFVQEGGALMQFPAEHVSSGEHAVVASHL